MRRCNNLSNSLLRESYKSQDDYFSLGTLAQDIVHGIIDTKKHTLAHSYLLNTSFYNVDKSSSCANCVRKTG